MHTAALITYLPSKKNRGVGAQENTTSFAAEPGPCCNFGEPKELERCLVGMPWYLDFVAEG